MRIILQRVTSARVSVGGKQISAIGPGHLILLGVKEGDTEKEAKELADKVTKLRIMADDAGKMNRSILDATGSLLVVSQFTLYADTSAGRRPSFLQAAKPDAAQTLYRLFVDELKRLGIKDVQTGQFGAYMHVELINDGPVTILLES